MLRKWQKLDERFARSLDRALESKGYISLSSIVESQYYFPQKHPMNLSRNSQRFASEDKLHEKFERKHWRSIVEYVKPISSP